MLHFYFYSIKNLINSNQYIGITSNLEQRWRRHLNKLKKGQHFNPHLQNAWNKYGEENFSFELLEENDFDSKEEAYQYEAKLIQQYDSINNGYNCNPGGLWTGPEGKFKEAEVYYIKAVCYFEKKVTGVLAKYFNCAPATIENIRIGRNYKPYCANFDNFSEEEKMQWYEDFCNHSDFALLEKAANSKPSNRRYNKEEVFIILRWAETKFTTAQDICDKLHIDYPRKPGYRCANKFRGIREGTSYKDFLFEYNRLSEEEKKCIERLYTERYIE